MILIVIICVALAIIFLSVVIFPLLEARLKIWQHQKEKVISKELDSLFFERNPKNIMRLYFILPPVLGLGFYVFTNMWFMIVVGAIVGLGIPTFVLKMRNSQRRNKVGNQLLDAVMALSSALKGGLSLLQAIEVVEEELPAPINQEFGLVIRENKMGVTMEDSLRNLEKRMEIEELSLLVNSILVARETGGDLTKVFSRLGTTIRDNRKLKDSIKTLTMQGRLQGVIMSFLPIGFVWWVMTFNRNHFDIMLNSDLGRMLLIVAVILQVIGMFMIAKFSQIKV
ncbi:MAG: type II secretion system F family protein [Candidatus Omnitrophota bacterium]|nr:type II secretion system F family protein [Candidatus Omnitrophota bacterium]